MKLILLLGTLVVLSAASNPNDPAVRAKLGTLGLNNSGFEPEGRK